MFARYVTDTGLISKIYKKFKKFYNNKTNNTINKCAQVMNR